VIAFLVMGISRARWFHRLGTSFECITWNALNQLTTVSKNGVTQAAYLYDPRKRRIEKEVLGQKTSFTYTGEKVVRVNAGTASGSYVYGPAIDEPLALEVAAGVTYRHADGLGSIVGLTNSAGSLTAAATYDPWGVMSPANVGDHGFTGRDWDSETNLYYYRARYYDAQTGRFIGEDAIEDVSADGANLYAYVNNDPVDQVDPSGRTPAVTIQACSITQRKAVEKAVKKARKAIKRCLSCEERDVLNKVEKVNIVCTTVTTGFISGADVCAQKNVGLPIIYLSPDAFNPPDWGCGCLESVLMHEVLHFSRGTAPGVHDAPDGRQFNVVKNCLKCAM